MDISTQLELQKDKQNDSTINKDILGTFLLRNLKRILFNSFLCNIEILHINVSNKKASVIVNKNIHEDEPSRTSKLFYVIII